MAGRWRAPEIPEAPVEALVRDNGAGGADPDGWTACASWRREADIPDEVYLGAVQAAG